MLWSFHFNKFDFPVQDGSFVTFTVPRDRRVVDGSKMSSSLTVHDSGLRIGQVPALARIQAEPAHRRLTSSSCKLARNCRSFHASCNSLKPMPVSNPIVTPEALEKRFESLRIPEVDLPSIAKASIKARIDDLINLRDDIVVLLDGPTVFDIGIERRHQRRVRALLELVNDEVGLYITFLESGKVSRRCEGHHSPLIINVVMQDIPTLHQILSEPEGTDDFNLAYTKFLDEASVSFARRRKKVKAGPFVTEESNML
jgi:hypothetical protein